MIFILERPLGGGNIKTRVRDGITYETILQYATQYKADLIVMGTHSHTGVEKILGDVAGKVIKNTEIPILIIPADKKSESQINKTQGILQYI